MDIFVANDKMYNSLLPQQGRRQVRGDRVRCRRGADGRRAVHLGHGSGFSRPRQRRLSRHRLRRARQRDLSAIPESREGRLRRCHRRTAAWLGSACRWPATRPPLPISTTMAGRISSSRAATCNPLDMHRACRWSSPTRCSATWAAARFAALTAEAGLTAQAPSRHRGSAVGDLNGDGRLDVVVTALSAPAEMWINDSPGSQSLARVRTWKARKAIATASGRGIKVTAGGVDAVQPRSFAAGYASSSAGPVHFGLGASKSADLVEIRWPSGITQELKNVAADTRRQSPGAL